MFRRDIIPPVKTPLALLIFGVVLISCSGSAPATPSENASPPSAASPSKAPNESAAIDVLRKTGAAQATYFKINRRYALTFDELVEAHLLTSEPTAAQTGYDFKLRPAADAQTYKVLVAPGGASAASVRHFFLDQTGTIRSETGKEAGAESPEVK